MCPQIHSLEPSPWGAVHGDGPLKKSLRSSEVAGWGSDQQDWCLEEKRHPRAPCTFSLRALRRGQARPPSACQDTSRVPGRPADQGVRLSTSPVVTFTLSFPQKCIIFTRVFYNSLERKRESGPGSGPAVQRFFDLVLAGCYKANYEI